LPFQSYIHLKFKYMNDDKKITEHPTTAISTDISPIERSLLDESIENSLSVDNENLKRAILDHTDDAGDLLNDESFAADFTGENLDIPGSDLDDKNEEIGEEDEENNGYSKADTD